jgi:hypothetical protein
MPAPDSAIISGVDDLAGLDRLDRWLNAQQGKPRLVLTWLEVWPITALLILTLTMWAFPGSLAARFLLSIVLAQPATIPLSYLASGLHALHARRARKNPARFRPRFAWRQFAFVSLLLSCVPLQHLANSMDIDSIEHNQPPVLAFLIFMLPCTCAVGLMIWNDRYQKRAARIRLATAARPPVSSGPRPVSRVP